VIGLHDQQCVDRLCEQGIGHVRLGGHGEHHVEKVRSVIHLVARIHERLADRVLVGHRRNRRQLRDQPLDRDEALPRIQHVDGVRIERRERPDDAEHDGHRVRVAAEAAIKTRELLVQHGVIREILPKLRQLRGRRELAEEQQVGDFDEGTIFDQLVDRITAVEQHAALAVHEGDGGAATRGAGKARIVRHEFRIVEQTPDVDRIRAERSMQDRQARAHAPALVR
jgi:hypothetical protein